MRCHPCFLISSCVAPALTSTPHRDNTALSGARGAAARSAPRPAHGRCHPRRHAGRRMTMGAAPAPARAAQGRASATPQRTQAGAQPCGTGCLHATESVPWPCKLRRLRPERTQRPAAPTPSRPCCPTNMHRARHARADRTAAAHRWGRHARGTIHRPITQPGRPGWQACPHAHAWGVTPHFTWPSACGLGSRQEATRPRSWMGGLRPPRAGVDHV